MITDSPPSLKPNPILRLVAERTNLNNNGHIFGGWILAQMDIAAGITAGIRARGAVATVAVDRMTFITPMLPGDIVSIYTTIERVGRSSIEVCVEVIADRRGQNPIRITEGSFTFVALDANHRPRPVD